MEFNTYQQRAKETAIYPDQDKIGGLVYAALGLAGEAGEFANKVKKVLRDHGGEVPPELRQELLLELGDTQWYLASATTELGAYLEAVAQMNLDKLQDRKRELTIGGEGDHR